MCQSLEENSSSLESEKNDLLEIITKLEMRSMNDNLMFYGIPENEGEDCKQLIRDIWTEQLEMSVDDANGVRIVRAHRVGGKRRSANKPRPIVAKFFDLTNGNRSEHCHLTTQMRLRAPTRETESGGRK